MARKCNLRKKARRGVKNSAKRRQSKIKKLQKKTNKNGKLY